MDVLSPHERTHELIEGDGSRFKLSTKGLVVEESLTYEEWISLGESVQRAARASMWWLGDWWCFGEKQGYGERYAEAKELPFTEQTLMDVAWVCRAITTSRRREGLTFTHHREVAALPPEAQDALLDRAIEESLSTRELRKAVRDIKALENKNNPPPIPKGKYSVIYADPPWQYRDERNLDGYDTNAASNSYPTMSLDELGDLPIKNLAANDCVLFMWTTAPLVIDAGNLGQTVWGFTYKQQIMWDKVNPGMGGLGHYTMCNHEILLIFTRGSPPRAVEKFDSVQVIKKSRKHSEKPERFREIIDAMYPAGPRIELFHRGDVREGWKVWGNEVQAR